MPYSPRVACFLVSLGLVMSACARNAVLEVDVEVPAGPSDRYAVVQFETDDVPFDAVWQRPDDYAGTQLTAEAQTISYSVVSESATTPIRIKVSFCTTPDCSGIDDAPDRVPALWYELPRALYIGKRTRWTADITGLPSDPPSTPIVVDRCEIEGCIQASDSTSGFCRVSDGRHYCE